MLEAVAFEGADVKYASCLLITSSPAAGEPGPSRHVCLGVPQPVELGHEVGGSQLGAQFPVVGLEALNFREQCARVVFTAALGPPSPVELRDLLL